MLVLMLCSYSLSRRVLSTTGSFFPEIKDERSQIAAAAEKGCRGLTEKFCLAVICFGIDINRLRRWKRGVDKKTSEFLPAPMQTGACIWGASETRRVSSNSFASQQVVFLSHLPPTSRRYDVCPELPTVYAPRCDDNNAIWRACRRRHSSEAHIH